VAAPVESQVQRANKAPQRRPQQTAAYPVKPGDIIDLDRCKFEVCMYACYIYIYIHTHIYIYRRQRWIRAYDAFLRKKQP
jgi:hypothetical protein